MLDEVSSISKRGTELWGHAMDPITCGLSLEAIVDDGYWARTGGELLLLGAGGSSLALTLYLHRRALAGQDVPSKVVVTNRRPGRLEEMQEVHRRLGIALPVEYHLAPTPDLNDARVAALPPDSVVANATGLGKDRPGSPLTDAVVFPQRATAWDFNYRGDLVFLDQARAQRRRPGACTVGRRLDLLHPRLDPGHRRGLRHRHPHRRAGFRRALPASRST